MNREDADLRWQNDEKKKLLIELKARLDDYRNRLTECGNDMAKMQIRIDDCEAENERLKHDNSNLRCVVSGYEQQLERLKKELEIAKADSHEAWMKRGYHDVERFYRDDEPEICKECGREKETKR
jgi:chromosome segregation ATPase